MVVPALKFREARRRVVFPCQRQEIETRAWSLPPLLPLSGEGVVAIRICPTNTTRRQRFKASTGPSNDRMTRGASSIGFKKGRGVRCGGHCPDDGLPPLSPTKTSPPCLETLHLPPNIWTPGHRGKAEPAGDVENKKRSDEHMIGAGRLSVAAAAFQAQIPWKKSRIKSHAKSAKRLLRENTSFGWHLSMEKPTPGPHGLPSKPSQVLTSDCTI